MEIPNPDSQSLPPGAQLEEFLIERVLGSGGFGITYLARDTSLGRQVVIKENLPSQFAWRETATGTVRPRHSTGGDADDYEWSMRNFLKEAETLASLDHPGIVRVLRKFETNGTAYFVMPFVEGFAFDTLIDSRSAKGQAFSEEELGGLIHRMLSALGYLHERGIYHRDIKPANILITMEGVPVLIDFGSARQRLSERSMTVIESAGYTPFEQLQSRGNVGPWSDLYALGGTLVKALTGEAPPKAMDRMRKDPYQPLAERVELRSQFTWEFLHGIDKSLAVDEENRWQNAKEWLATVVATPVAAAPAPVPEIPNPKVIETPAPEYSQVPEVTRAPRDHGVLITVVMLALALVGGAGWWFGIEEPKRAETARVARAKADAEQRQREEDENARIAEEAAAAKAPASATKEKPFVNSLGMKFVAVPIVGGPTNGKRVLFGVWDVRVKDYRVFAEETKREWLKPGFAQNEEHPVVMVSWDDAKAFCAWLTKRERDAGKLGANEEYRLPSDHEWSCAVGIGEREDATASPKDKDGKIAAVFPWGTQWLPPKGAGNYGSINGYDDGYANTSPVGSFSANQYGLYDMSGNVWQWCEDFWESGSNSARVLRGGSWNYGGEFALRSSYRYYAPLAGRYVDFGFRCVLVVSGG